MDHRQKNLLLGGAVVAGSVIGFYILYRSYKSTKAILTAQTLPRELVVRILKEVRKERIQYLTGSAETEKNLEYLLKDYTIETRHQINEIAVKICEKNNTNVIELRDACENQFRQDREVEALFEKAFLIFDEVFLRNPAKKVEEKPAGPIIPNVPEYFTPEVTLNLMKEVSKIGLSRMNEIITEFKKNGGTIPTNPNDIQAMQPLLKALDALDFEAIRVETLMKHGLDKFNEAPEVLYENAREKFRMLNPNQFNNKLNKLLDQHKKCLDALMSGAPNAIILLEGIGSHLDQAPEELKIPMVRGFSQKLENNSYLQGFAKFSAETDD